MKKPKIYVFTEILCTVCTLLAVKSASNFEQQCGAINATVINRGHKPGPNNERINLYSGSTRLSQTEKLLSV